MSKKRIWTFILLAAALSVMLTSSQFVMGKGKPPQDENPPVQYQITWVEVPGNRSNFVRGINNNGVAVGHTSNEDNTIHYAFQYTVNNGMLDLNSEIDPDSGWVLRQAFDINDSGQIVGKGEINGEEHAFRLRPAGSDGSGLPIENTVDDLGKLNPTDTDSSATAINNSGDVCGYSRDESGERHAFYYSDNSGMIEIAPGIARDINSYGQVVGATDIYAFRYEPVSGSIEYFSSPDGNMVDTSAYGINDDGQIVGATQFVAPKPKNQDDIRAFRFTEGIGYENLGAEELTAGTHINSSGDVVVLQFYRGYIYLEEHSTLVNLDNAVTGPEAAVWTNDTYKVRPRYLNDLGQITGHVTFGAFDSWGFILTPISP